MTSCDHCGQPYDPAEFDATHVGVPDPDGLCWSCLTECCVNCGDIPPYPIDETLQMCEGCCEHIMGPDYDPED